MIRRFLAVLLAAVGVLGGTAAAALAEYPPVSQLGAVSSTTVQPGGEVDFAGAGFAAGSEVTVNVNDSLYTTVKADGTPAVSLGRTMAHVQVAAYARPAAVAADGSASFSVKVTLTDEGANVLTGTGVDPAGNPRVVRATVTVAAATVTQTAVKPSGSNLPFTGAAVIIPGAIVGLTMTAGGLLLLSTVRARRAGHSEG